MNDPDQTVTFPVVSIGDDLPEQLWTQDDPPAVEEDRQAVALMPGLVSLAFIRASLKRKALLWCTVAAVGLLIGCGLYLKFPPAYQASTSVLVNDGPNVDTSVTIQTDAALAQSHTVAASVVQQLGLPQTAGSFLATYSVTPLSTQVLQITVHAHSSSDAVRRAAAVATAYLQFRADYARIQYQELVTQLNQQVSQAQRSLDSISSQINRLSAQPSSPSAQATLTSLQTQRTNASNNLAQVQQYVNTSQETAQATMNAMVDGSEVIDHAALVPHSRMKGVALYVAGGLVAGLAVGMGIVVVMALVSDRLRRRDDVADALGAPVGLSVGSALRERRGFPRLPWRARTRSLNSRRVAAHLRTFVSGGSRSPAGLAIVAVDNAPDVARPFVALAVSCVARGKQVVVADLSDGALAARLLGTKKPGVHEVNHDGAHLRLVVPDRGEVAPIGPLRRGTFQVDQAQAGESLAAACDSADVILTLTTLDPAFGGDHLASWATDAVAVVTAGRSSGERIHGVGEMIRLAGTRLDSVVLIEADKTDVSLGVPRTPDEAAHVSPV